MPEKAEQWLHLIKGDRPAVFKGRLLPLFCFRHQVFQDILVKAKQNKDKMNKSKRKQSMGENHVNMSLPWRPSAERSPESRRDRPSF